MHNGLVRLILLLLLALPASAERHHRLALWAGSDLTIHPEVAWHGIARIRYELSGLPREGRFVIDFNSDTLRLSLEGLRSGRVEYGLGAGAEVFNAGLLGDYWRNGHRDPARGFRASWAAAGGYLKVDLQPSFFELAIAARRWFFEPTDETSPRLLLPPEACVGEFRVRYTLWSLAPDVSLWEAQRPFARVLGVAVGLELGLDARSEARPWGARDSSFAPADLRNDPSTIVLSARQWLRAGVRLSGRVRLQLEESALWMSGADDLDRARVGSLNPYVVPLAGAPWGAYLVDRLAAAQLSLHIRVFRELELGPLLDGTIVNDVDRSGDRPGALGALGAFVDFRHRGWQLDVRGGWTWPSGATLFASLGWGWFR